MKKLFFLLVFISVTLFGADIIGKEYKDLDLKQESCPIKTVSILKHKDWLGYVELKDGKIVALSSPKYAFAYMLIEQKKDDKSVLNVYVTDYKTKKIIDAKTAYYVFWK